MQVQRRCSLSSQEQQALFDAFLACTELVEVYYRWRPNLPDESDHHVLELAVAAGSATILTFNRRDFSRGELRFPDVAIQSPGHWLNKGEEDVSTLTIRLPDAKHERLKAFARTRGVSVNKLVEELATVALAQADAENR